MPLKLVDNELFVDFDEPEEYSSVYDSEGNQLTRAQAEFFQQSKCVDEDGSLFLVYRATNHDYDTFDLERVGTGAGSIYGKGIYFSTERESVKIYGNTIKAYYLNLKRPFRYEAIDDKQAAVDNVKSFARVLKQNGYPVDKELCQQLLRDILQNDGGLDTMIELTCGPEKATDFFQKCGYDGIMNLDIMDFVAYQPGQIKVSANKAPTSALSTTA
jgi:hypothetical protein